MDVSAGGGSIEIESNRIESNRIPGGRSKP
jgi:hypothetical protein